MVNLEIGKSRYKHVPAYIVAAFIVFMLALPPFWMIITSIKTGRDVFSIPPKWLFIPSLENYKVIFSSSAFSKVVLNTVIVASFATVITQLFGSMAAFSISRYHTGGKPMLYGTLIMRVLPPVVIALPLFIMFAKLGIIDTIEGLILAYVGFLLPNTIWLLISFFDGIPKSIEEAARIDGCSNLYSFLHISLPLARSGMIVTSVYNITGAWNHFFYALILAPTKTRALSVEASQYVGEYVVQWGQIAAIASVLILPPAILIFIIQKHLVGGLTLGGVKG